MCGFYWATLYIGMFWLTDSRMNLLSSSVCLQWKLVLLTRRVARDAKAIICDSDLGPGRVIKPSLHVNCDVTRCKTISWLRFMYTTAFGCTDREVCKLQCAKKIERNYSWVGPFVTPLTVLSHPCAFKSRSELSQNLIHCFCSKA